MDFQVELLHYYMISNHPSVPAAEQIHDSARVLKVSLGDPDWGGVNQSGGGGSIANIAYCTCHQSKVFWSEGAQFTEREGWQHIAIAGALKPVEGVTFEIPSRRRRNPSKGTEPYDLKEGDLLLVEAYEGSWVAEVKSMSIHGWTAYAGAL